MHYPSKQVLVQSSEQEHARFLAEAGLLEPGHFTWTGRLPLASFLGANNCSHYRTATKILRRWL
jgi:hypothetical protein